MPTKSIVTITATVSYAREHSLLCTNVTNGRILDLNKADNINNIIPFELFAILVKIPGSGAAVPRDCYVMPMAVIR